MSAKVTSSSDQKLTKIYVWSMPRVLGTAFLKCMSYVDGMQIFNEPFTCAYHFGPEAVLKPNEITASFILNAIDVEIELENAFDDNICTFAWVKKELEADYPGKKILLVKDQAFSLDNRYNLIPSGFRHVFLIRHPYKVLPSWKGIMVKLYQLDMDTASLADILDENVFENPYANQFNLLKHVKENVDPNPVVFDADSLQSNPESTVSQFCQAVGIPYTDHLLEWPAERDIIKSWKANRISIKANLLENEGGFYDEALMSTKFKPLKPLPTHEELSPDVQKIADESMPFYEKMREMCTI